MKHCINDPQKLVLTIPLTLVTVLILMIFCQPVLAQNTFPATGYVGIGTTSPDAAMTILNDDVSFADGNLRLSAYAGINPGANDNFVGQVRFEKYRGTVAAPLKAAERDCWLCYPAPFQGVPAF